MNRSKTTFKKGVDTIPWTCKSTLIGLKSWCASRGGSSSSNGYNMYNRATKVVLVMVVLVHVVEVVLLVLVVMVV